MEHHHADIQSAMLHAAGRGISPVPHSGAGLWDSLRGFAKKAYHFTAPHLKKAASSFARDIVGDLNRTLQSGEKRMLEI